MNILMVLALILYSPRDQTTSVSSHVTPDFVKVTNNVIFQQCLPQCSRWNYPVLSASYGQIQYALKDDEAVQLANRSWSRIRVLMPDSSRIHEEQPPTPWYIQMCEISGMMGVYIGVSMITFIQIVAYGAYIIWKKLRDKILNSESTFAPMESLKKWLSVPNRPKQKRKIVPEPGNGNASKVDQAIEMAEVHQESRTNEVESKSFPDIEDNDSQPGPSGLTLEEQRKLAKQSQIDNASVRKVKIGKAAYAFR